MVQQFLNHIDKNSLCLKGERILIAVSGGVDSMVLLHLLRLAGFDIGVAHCNFQLRGDASEKDEALIRRICEERNIPFHGTRVDTEEYAWSKGLSIQVAARDLRYNFFHALVKEYNYQWIATAHHLSDSIETVLLNLTRGTGVDGLTGIPVKIGNIIRPLLNFTRKDIHDFAIRERIEWREDESNLSDHYTRNVIRHQVIPVLQSINADFESNFSDTLERIQGMRELAHDELGNFDKSCVTRNGNKVTISRVGLQKYASPAVVLWEILKPFGFHFHECREIIRDHQAGKIFNSKTYRLVVDREVLMVAPDEKLQPISIQVNDELNEIINGHQRLLFTRNGSTQLPPDLTRNVAYLDLANVVFPLVWRSWRAGDLFSPLGMRTHKKVSDFLIDLKIPRVDKDAVTVLESNGEIVWVVGFRISEKAKITPQTRMTLRIEWQPDITSLHN